MHIYRPKPDSGQNLVEGRLTVEEEYFAVQDHILSVEAQIWPRK